MSSWPTLWLAAVASCASLVQPAVAQQRAGELDASPALFSVMAALNAAGYDDGLASPNAHPLRAEMRRWVADRKPASLPVIREFFLSHRAPNSGAELSQYVTFALSVDGPPGFKPKFKASQAPPEAAALEGFGELMARFHREAEIDEAFRRAQPAFEQVIERYHRPVVEAVLEANAYLRNPTSGLRGRRFQIFFDLLAAPNYVLPRSLGDEYFVVVTPSPEPRIRDIRHAYLDYLIDPLAIRNSPALEKKKSLGELAQASSLLGEDYRNDFVRLAGMSTVYAVEARLDRSEGAKFVEQMMREGFILTAYFYESLPGYEKQEQSFRLYYPSMIEGMDIAKEDKRIAQVQFVSERAVRKVQAAPPPKPVEPVGVELTVAKAEELYARRDLAGAAAGYRAALQQDAPKSVHAKALFGLARIAALEKKPELSQQLFERTLEMDPEPFERGWANVYLARLSKAAQEMESAAKYYRAALAVAGASDGALNAAKSELAGLPAAPPKQDP
ncbi:MAG: hypothetical protein HY821_07625 [Acidobacteria bacterium]|nr:hypothetical protein [Acidobacteriota bacterium]